MPKQVVIDVKPDGEVIVDAQGFEGLECEQATKAIEQALGTVDNRQRKPEYHRRPRGHQQQGA